MSAPSRWLPVALAVVLVGGVAVLARTSSSRVRDLLSGGAAAVRGHLPDAPHLADPDLDAGRDRALAQVEAAGADDTGGPTVDLDHPSEKDWRFLEGVLADGAPEARLSAARAMVLAGDPRAVRPLFRAAASEGPDREVFCMAALEVLRLQRREDALPLLLERLVDPDARSLSVACRAEVSDRFALAGGKDPDHLAPLAGHPSAEVRAFVAGYLAEADPRGQAEALAGLACDPDPRVRERVPAAIRPACPSAPPDPPEDPWPSSPSP